VRIGFSGNAGGGFLTEPDVAAEAGEVLVAALGLELGRGASVLGQVGQRGVPQLVQRPPGAVRVDPLAEAWRRPEAGTRRR
jgi:hypothetical protein